MSVADSIFFAKNEQSCEIDYISIENYLTETTANKITNYFELNIDQFATKNINSRFNNRIISYEKIMRDNPTIQRLIDTAVNGVMQEIISFYNIDNNNNNPNRHKNLFPANIHLVRWTKGHSLGLHADNSWLNGTPNFVPFNDYSCIIYLNDDYTGGEFYFNKSHINSNDDSIIIKPKTGQLVAFTAGLNHVHGVKKVLNGTRYTLACWFTKDKTKRIIGFNKLSDSKHGIIIIVFGIFSCIFVFYFFKQFIYGI